MAFLIVFGVVFTIAVIIAVGNVIGSAQSPPNVTPGKNESDVNCADLCRQFNDRRSEHCMAQAAERNAATRLDLLNSQRDSAQKAWATALAASLAALFIPFVGH